MTENTIEIKDLDCVNQIWIIVLGKFNKKS